jgi:hypothetical protein
MIDEIIDFLSYAWGRGKKAFAIYTILMLILLPLSVMDCNLPIWFAVTLYFSPFILAPITVWIFNKLGLYDVD